MEKSDYVCPNCLAPLEQSETSFECAACHLSYPIIAGIPVFAEFWKSAYGVMSPPQLRELVELCGRHGWEKGVSDFLDGNSVSDADSWAAYFAPEKRAAGRLLLQGNPQARVLDLGCGIGPLSINFARYAKKVIGVDRGLEQVQLLTMRAREARLGNFQAICAGDRKHLPFPEDYFDVVVLNGVLEWVASTRENGHPRDHQREFLCEVHRVLKPEGEIYIGIENRFALSYWMGAADEHTGLRFVTLLPRRIANLWSRLKTGKPYRIYTYSRRGYRKLLEEAGFAATRFYLSRSSYRKISQIVEGQNHLGAIEAFCTKPRLREMKRQWGRALAYPYLAHSYSIIAGKKQVPPSMIEEAVAKLEAYLSSRGEVTKLHSGLVRIGESSVAVISAREKSGTRNFVIRIPLIPQAAEHQRANFKLLGEMAAQLKPGSALKTLLPGAAVELDCGEHTVFAESKCPGLDLRECYRAEDHEGIFRLGLDFLLSMHRELDDRQVHSEQSMRDWFSKRVDYLYRTVRTLPKYSLQGLVEEALDCLHAESLAKVFTHGDFWLRNLLSLRSGDALTGVVDWKFGDENGIPLLDLLQLLMSTKGLASGKGFTWEIAKRLKERRFQDDEKPWVEEYRGQLGLSESTTWALVFMAWLDWIYRRVDMQGYIPSWRRAQIADFLEAMNRELSRV